MIEWGDVGTWVGGIGTTAAVGVALWQVLRSDARDREVERRAFAAKVSGWFATLGTQGSGEGMGTLVGLMNRSEQPVYQAVVHLVFVQGAGPRRGEDVEASYSYRCVVDVIPPGEWRVELPSGWAGMHRDPGVEVAFSDPNGQSWIRRANGVLEEIETQAPEHYGLSRPFDFATLKAA